MAKFSKVPIIECQTVELAQVSLVALPMVVYKAANGISSGPREHRPCTEPATACTSCRFGTAVDGQRARLRVAGGAVPFVLRLEGTQRGHVSSLSMQQVGDRSSCTCSAGRCQRELCNGGVLG